MQRRQFGSTGNKVPVIGRGMTMDKTVLQPSWLCDEVSIWDFSRSTLQKCMALD
jgi:hypothetical protein